MKNRINLDMLGIGTSVACAVHCALLPLFLTSIPLFGINIIHNTAFEIGMIVLAFGIGAFSLHHGYRKHHHSFLPLVLFTNGIILLTLKQFFIEFQYWLLIPAVALIIIAHLLNFRFCRVHNHAHSDDCNH